MARRLWFSMNSKYFLISQIFDVVFIQICLKTVYMMLLSIDTFTYCNYCVFYNDFINIPKEVLILFRNDVSNHSSLCIFVYM